MGRLSKWSPEFREEAVRLYRESDESVMAVARRLELGPETFRKWVRQDEIARGARDGTTREEHAEIVKLLARDRSSSSQSSSTSAGTTPPACTRALATYHRPNTSSCTHLDAD